MAPAGNKVFKGLARVLGIPVHNGDGTEATGGLSTASTLTSKFVEQDPTAGEYLRELAPTRTSVKNYVVELFPFINWITRYNATWLTGDVIAGWFSV
jgi:sodium-independent sulfate anion transporter 11